MGLSTNQLFGPKIYKLSIETIALNCLVIAIFTIGDQCKVVYGLSNGAIFNDLEQPITQFSRSRYSLMLKIFETVRDT